ncbi:MAG: NADH:flavin oxidoreductase/NADH oxidase family protein [Candidatus Pelagadaptatus aseana]|uniref:NADH:flavin oxidoreductase/NADH oxidase family protein n=1 Tax=Candidatus Pelagadaptatus aseana TaxID=3120508 RepID=UPI0039B268D7
MSKAVFEPLQLPNGATLNNRLAKAAMEEGMANARQQPSEGLIELYRAWAEGGVGLLITGNVMVDVMAMTGPGGVALQQDSDLAPFKRWASAAQTNGTRVWMQINHPGRQVYRNMGGKCLAPSAVALDMGKHSAMFGQPRAMNEEEIMDVRQRFVITAKRAEAAGFDGVQVHAAHGYLLAQFLSPLTNQRQDQWGGSLANRASLLLDIVRDIRSQCGADFCVSVKLNSADFQRGGFEVEDARQVVAWLAEAGVDLVELSGGSYESPAMQGRAADGRTLAREAYFLEFAESIAREASVPVMTTGGIRRLAVAEQVIASGVAMVGIASALSYQPTLPEIWRQAPDFVAEIPPVNWKDKALGSLATHAMIKRQLQRLGSGRAPKQKQSPLWALITDMVRKSRLTKRYRKSLGLTGS